MRTMRRGVVLVLVAMWLVACGQTGPLYLPDEEQKDEDDLTSMLD